jgi:hypothetical protein
MLIAQQIIGVLLGGFSALFMLWFLANLIRDSRSRSRRRAHPPVEAADSWQARSFRPQAPSTSAPVPSRPERVVPRPEPQFGPPFGQSSRTFSGASR